MCWLRQRISMATETRNVNDRGAKPCRTPCKRLSSLERSAGGTSRGRRESTEATWEARASHRPMMTMLEGTSG